MGALVTGVQTCALPFLRGDRKLGYLAPPLYGVWSTAPYFHNGSVPNLWEVLKPSERKPIWRRTSAPPIDGGLSGFDYSLETGYDRTRSEERRVGKECVSTCRVRWWPDH